LFRIFGFLRYERYGGNYIKNIWPIESY